MITTPNDIPSFLRFLESGSEDFTWPTGYANYLAVAVTFRSSVFRLIENAQLMPHERAIVLSVLPLIITDGERLYKVLLDQGFARQRNLDVLADSGSSPLLSYFLRQDDWDTVGRDNIMSVLAGFNHSRRMRQGIRATGGLALTSLNMVLRSSRNRIDVYNDAELSSEYLSRKQDQVQLLMRPEYWPVPRGLGRNPIIEQLAGEIVDIWVKGIDDTPVGRLAAIEASAIGRGVIERRLRVALSTFAWMSKRLSFKKLGDCLVGGTPKPTGILLDFLYRDRGRDVVRFSHGGDRTFFDDQLWPFSEFIFASRYGVHGWKSCEVLDNRYHKKSRSLIKEYPEFISYGSSKHLKIFEMSGRIKRNIQEKAKVVLVAGSFLGEELFAPLDFKLPDVLALDLQLKLLTSLRNSQFNVGMKPHPKGLHKKIGSSGVLNHRYLQDIEILEGKFDVISIEADCLVFDFAGSAFFDALASNKGIVLLDTMHRTWDESARKILETRCRIVPAYLDQKNRLEFCDRQLEDAVHKAIEDVRCSDSFYDMFFKKRND